MLSPYLRVLRIPHVGALFLFGLLGSLPLGMAGLGLLLTTQARTGSIAAAGLVAAAFGLGNAAGITIQGRLMDRLGHSRVLLPASIVSGLALGISAFLCWQPVLLSAAAVAGLFYPATISSVRVLSTSLITDADTRIAAYVLLAVSFGLVMVAGPLLVSGIVALTSPPAAVLTAAAIISIAGIGFAETPAVRRHQTLEKPRTTGRRRLSPGLLTLLVASTCLGFASGAKAVSLPAAAISQGLPVLAGIGFAAMSIGDLIGGLGYGAIRWRATRPRQLIVSLLMTVLVAAVAVPTSRTVTVLFPVLLASGVLGACVPICMSALLDNVVPPASLTSAYTAMVSLSLVASAAGNATAGALVQRGSPATGFALAASAALLALVWTALRRSRWHLPPPPRTQNTRS